MYTPVSVSVFCVSVSVTRHLYKSLNVYVLYVYMFVFKGMVP